MTNFAQFHFAAPVWLGLGLLALGLLVWLHRHAAAARRRQLAQIVAPHAIAELTRSHSPARRSLKEFLLLAAVGLMALALARPQWGEPDVRGQPFVEDVVFVLDCSRSMLATDVPPDRLARSKNSIMNFVRHQGRGRVGLVAFAGGTFLQCPLTFDYAAFEESLMSLDTRAIPVGGTDIGLALQEAARALDKKSKHKLIVLLTDGEDLEKRGVKEAAALAREGVTIFAIGVGTPAGTELRAAGPNGKMDFVRDEKGMVVRSRLDESTLQAIAKATGGAYYPLGRLGEGLAKMRQHLETTGGGVARTQGRGVDRYYVPLALALLLLVVESLIGTRRRNASENSPQHPKAGAVAATLLALGMVFSANAAATNETMDAVSTSPPAPTPVTARDCYNAGTKKFAAGKLDEAEALLQNALDRQDEALQPVTLYNVGHVRFAQGVAELKKAPAQKSVQPRCDQAVNTGADAIDSIVAALASDNMQTLVAAYQRGRGAKRNLNDAFAAIRLALEAHGRTLEKWRRALQDFRGSAELGLPGTNATHNAEVVEQAIAKLVDADRKNQMCAMNVGNTAAKLDALMKQLKGKIPKGQLGSAPGDEEDGDEPNFITVEQSRGLREAGAIEGKEKEFSLSPEEVGRLLNDFMPPNRRLSMSQQESKTKPKDSKRSDW